MEMRALECGLKTSKLVEKMKSTLISLLEFLRSSKRTILVITITAVSTIAISAIASAWLAKTIKLYVPSLGIIKTLGVEAYWDKNLQNQTEAINWGTIWPGSSKNFTFYLQSISNTETTLHLNTTNWNPANISEYMTLSWNYNDTILHPNETIQVTLVLTTSSSNTFLHYLITNDVKEFNFDIIISTSEQIG